MKSSVTTIRGTWCLIWMRALALCILACAHSVSAEKSFKYYPQKDTVYLAPQCDCQIPKDKDIQAPPQTVVDTSIVYEGQTPVYTPDSNAFDVIVLDTVMAPPPCQCPRIPNDFEADRPQSNHTIGLSLGSFSYTYLRDRDMGYQVVSGGGEIDGFKSSDLGLQVMWMDSAFYLDPAYYGIRLGYAGTEGVIKIEDEEREQTEVEIQSTHIVIGGVYGWWWQWESGFTISAQFALGYPIVSESSFENPNNIRQSEYDKGTEAIETGFHNLSYIQGTRLQIGWTF